MNKKTPRFFSWITLATFVGGGFAAPAGQITQFSGDVSVSAQQSAPSPASQGQPIESGQIVTVGDGGRAMLQFRDGRTIALKFKTVFKVDRYEYDQAAPEKGESFFSLLQGGLRAITGLIGSSNRAGWKLATPTATMGIRGTDFIAATDQGLYLKVNSGAVSTTNSSGTTVFTAGQTGFAATGTAAGTSIPASSVPAGAFGDLDAVGRGGASGRGSDRRCWRHPVRPANRSRDRCRHRCRRRRRGGGGWQLEHTSLAAGGGNKRETGESPALRRQCSNL